jgi:hypothetical protein
MLSRLALAVRESSAVSPARTIHILPRYICLDTSALPKFYSTIFSNLFSNLRFHKEPRIYVQDLGVMSGIEVAGVVLGAVPLLLYAGTGRTLTSIVFFVQNYGLVGVFICTFGSREVWRIQVQILSSTKDSDVMDFKRSAQDDSNIIAVAVSLYY